MAKLRYLIVVIAAVLGTGCVCSYGQSTRKTVRKDFVQRGLSQASIDLKCPQDQIEITTDYVAPINAPYRNFGSKVVAHGCGRTATYVRREKSWDRILGK